MKNVTAQNLFVWSTGIQNAIQYMHWSTPSYSAHTALGEAYSSISSEIDDLIEDAIGKSIISRTDFESILTVPEIKYKYVNIDTNIEILKTYKNQLENIYDSLSQSPIFVEDIKDIYHNIFNILNKLLYKLENLK